MHIAAFPAGLRRFSLDDPAAQPWANGGGVTREISAGAVAGSTAAPWDWRFSVADIVAEGVFSRFDGIERQAILVDGKALTLCGEKYLCFHAIGDGHAFAGETLLHARPAGGPVRLFNAMSRRGRADVVLQVHRDSADVITDPCQHYVFLAAGGDLDVSCRHATVPQFTFRLKAGEGIVLNNLRARLHLTALDSGACTVQATAARIASPMARTSTALPSSL
ncbi:hypothetical protein D8I24_3239 (plasmid) [Cupriavidus necator H850]|uniref:HutD/Ves family protein n=1 Tax=Cupriavidus necator TaxID=106590 RepID=UPI00129E6835|nr:HutD family protein [Cupriavidus necator]KAI3602688.1 hypothetical protein D8I24_3239 [Cupriavidus necator H850]